MKVLYLDCASGVSGDMLLGSLLDLGLETRWLRSQVALLPLKGYTLSARTVKRQGFGGVKATVTVKGRHEHRGLKEIRAIVEGGRLPPRISRAAMKIFRRLVETEARIHRTSMQRVHLHEVGAVDAIIDIVGAVAGIDALIGLPGEPGAGRLVCSALNVGHGTVKMDHGFLPVPAPATAALLTGVPVYAAGPPGERVTPTGAAIVTTLAGGFGPPPPMAIERIGYGAGSRDFDGHPNLLRALLGSPWPDAGAAAGEVTVIECTIDDMNPQGYGWLMERLFGAGALEVFYTPVQMKKNRPGVLVTVLTPPDLLPDLSRLIFEETTTIGIRHRSASRIELERRTETVTTPYGRVNVKISSLEGRVVQVQPEYDECRRIASRRKVPLEEIRSAALAAYGRRSG